MSEAPKDGGPAFPFAPTDLSNSNYLAGGMSLRDWFAGQALAGMNANPDWNENSWADRAKNCYLAADAMLEARE